jgi:hypothetical protein
VINETLSPDLFSSLFVSLKLLSSSSPKKAFQALESIRNVSKFDLILSLLPAKDLDAIRDIFNVFVEKVKDENIVDKESEEISLRDLKRAYKIA